MSDRSGCGLTELTILENLQTLTAGRRPQHHVKSSTVLAAVEKQIGLGPRYGYQILADLTRPWMVPLPLVSGRGNFGSRDFDEPAASHYTESRQSRVGQLVLDAEAGRIAPVPVGLINGSLYRGGRQPPLEPSAVIRALRRLLDSDRISDADLLAVAGGPYSVAGCDIDGDVHELLEGRPVEFRETGRITVTGVPVPEPAPERPAGTPGHYHSGAGPLRPPLPAHLIIESMPWQVSIPDVIEAIAATSTSRLRHRDYPEQLRQAALPIADINDEYEPEGVRIAVRLLAGSDPDAVRDRLLQTDSLNWRSTWQFPAALTDMLRSWVMQAKDEDVTDSLAQLERAIDDDRVSRSNRA